MATPATVRERVAERILVSEGRYFTVKRVLDVVLALTLLLLLLSPRGL